MRRALLPALLLLAASLAGVTGAGTQALAPADATTAPAASGCADVFVLGVDGDGQAPRRGSGLTAGPTVEGVAAPYVGAIKAGRTVKFQRLAVTTPPLSRLTQGASRRTGYAALRPASVRAWAAPIATLAARATTTIRQHASECPEQQLFLVGSAQGAAALHQVLAQSWMQPILPRLSGVVLVSDPDRIPGSTATRIGKPAAPRSGIGVLASRRHLSAALPTLPAPGRIWSVCTGGDLLCAGTRSTVAKGKRVVGSYSRTMLAPTASDAATRTREWPAPKPATRTVSVAQGSPVDVQLATDVAPAQQQVTFMPTSTPPDGLTLSSDGHLSGTPTTAGRVTIDYTVQGDSPATTPHTGTVSLVVAGPSALAAGGQSACEIQPDTTAWCWGANQFGQLGDATTTAATTPVQASGDGYAQISTGGATTCAVKTDHTLWCWGLNDFAQTGHPKSGPVMAPKQIGDRKWWSQVSVAWSHACATRTDGTVACWGQDLHGELGDGQAYNRTATPVTVGSATDWTSVRAAGYHTCGLRADGSAWCWGNESLGSLGNGANNARTPVQVPGSWSSLSSGWGDTCGVHTDGSLACWGANRRGELGTGDQTDAASPVTAAGSAGRQWSDVAAGEQSTCALDASGTAWCWGDDRYGQSDPARHDDTITQPTAVPGLPPLTSIAAGWLGYCGLDSSGQRWCWGDPTIATSASSAPTGASRRQASAETGTSAAAARSAARIAPAEQRTLDRLSPAGVAQHDLAARPAVPASATTGPPVTIRTMTFNVLGSQHTAPGGDKPAYAPGRLRAEWGTTLIDETNAGLVGTQEMQPDQVNDYGMSTTGRFAIFPGTADGYSAAPQSLMYKTGSWTPVWTGSISMPFTDTWRPQPVVRLQDDRTGRQLYWINVHFAAGNNHPMRVKDMRILLTEVRTLKKDGLPILVTGDFNEKKWVFCQLVGNTTLRAAQGGSARPKTCSPPSRIRIDWIFGTGGTFSNWKIFTGPEVVRATDHTVQSASFTIG